MSPPRTEQVHLTEAVPVHMTRGSKGAQLSMEMVYQGSGHTDAFAVRDWLRQNKISAEVRGQHRLGLLGAIPIDETWPTVWVPHTEVERAQQAILLFQGPSLVHPEWQCAKCDEVNGPVFASCWSCGTDRPDLAEEASISVQA